MSKPLVTRWSFLAFQECADHLDETQQLVLHGVGELAAAMNGWFFHTFTAPGGALIRCDAYPESDSWKVLVRLAQREGAYPEIVADAQNEQFADFWEIKSNFRPS
jgi:hypothetical protein